MKSKKLYIRVAAVLVLLLLIGLGFTGNDLSTNGALAKEKLQMDQRFSLRELRSWKL